jgi:hypothetical protein
VLESEGMSLELTLEYWIEEAGPLRPDTRVKSIAVDAA